MTPTIYAWPLWNQAWNYLVKTITIRPKSIACWGQFFIIWNGIFKFFFLNFITKHIKKKIIWIDQLIRDEDSEATHKKTLHILENILSNSDLFYLMAKSTLGIFYKMIGRTADAISVLLEVINSLSIQN